MDRHRTSLHPSHMDYNRDSKDEKPSTDERLDSGLDSLKEEESALDNTDHRGRRHVAPSAIIHEAKDYIKQIIELSKNTEFLDTQNDQRQTSLHLAVITNQASVCERLLVAGCDPTLVDGNGDTALHIACRHGNLPCFSVITQNCLPHHLSTAMAAYNYHGQNCLHLASVHGFLSLVENLVDLGADIDAKEQRSGRGALHLAVDQQNLSLVQLLLKKGADPNLLTSAGHTPFHLTFGRDNEQIRQELYSLTKPGLRELPDSEDDDTEEEDEEEDDDDEVGYDDIQWNGH
ncbi:hypothetical protein WMY93_017872 [Mugilogobius chulae]|uniref:NF-kappa-B inhibitor alpha n=1 Tax=Mugilogobius chulae TaxID=88201 RepID=A0AAW0NPE5_9GOBI